MQGFTLIELIVVVFIMIITTSLSWANYRKARQNSELNIAALKIASDIRQAQNYALSAKYSENPANRSFILNTRPNAWGIFFSSTLNNDRYIMFADSSSTGPVLPPSNKYEPANNEAEYGPIFLPESIVVNTIRVVNKTTLGNFATTTDTVAHIAFIPPDPITIINSTTALTIPKFYTEIELKDTRTEATTTVKVNFFGNIYVE